MDYFENLETTENTNSAEQPEPFIYITPDLTTYNNYEPQGVDGYRLEGELLEKYISANGSVRLEVDKNNVSIDVIAVTPPEPQETAEQKRISALEDALMQTDEIAIELYEAQAIQDEINAAQDETVIELYEAQAVQEEINIAQDEALIEIYELIGG